MIIGVTGRAGSGKSFFEKVVCQATESVCIDLDKVGHEALENEELQTRLANRFGQHIRDKDGINRKELGNIVFNDPNALEDLNRYIHPMMKDMVRELLNKNSDKTCFVIGALIQEIGLTDDCDKIVTIDADDEGIKKNSPSQYDISRRQRSRQSYRDEGDIVITNTFDDGFLEKIQHLMKNNFRITSTLDKINAQEE